MNDFVVRIFRKILYGWNASEQHGSGVHIRSCGKIRILWFFLTFYLWGVSVKLAPVPAMFLEIGFVTIRGRKWRKSSSVDTTLLWQIFGFRLTMKWAEKIFENWWEPKFCNAQSSAASLSKTSPSLISTSGTLSNFLFVLRLNLFQVWAVKMYLALFVQLLHMPRSGANER